MIFKIRAFYLLLLLPFALACPPIDTSVPEFPIAQRDKEVRSLIADILDTPTFERKADESNLKRAVLKRSVAVYHLLNNPDILKDTGIPREIDTWISPLRERLKGVPYSQLIDTLNKIDSGEFKKHEESLDEAIRLFNFDTTADLKKIKIPDIGENWKRFLESVLRDYFADLNLIDKKRILGFLLRNTDAQAKPTEVMLALISGSGPYFQKLMQLLGDFLEKAPEDVQNSDFLEMKEGLGNVKNRLPPIDPYYVDKYVKELESLGVHIKVGESLGAASVGEVYKAEYWPNGLEKQSLSIVIKLMRPQIEEIALREEAFFRAKAKQVNPMMEASFSQISKQIWEELDYGLELEKLKKGGKIYGTSESSNIRVVRPIENFPHRKYWMAMELGGGKTFRDARGRLSDNQQSKLASKLEMMSKALLLDRFADEFLLKVFFIQRTDVFRKDFADNDKFAFFHGDLHEGNMLLRIDERIFHIMDNRHITADNLTKAVVEDLLDERDGANHAYIQMILVDFGNAHTLSLSQSKALFNMFISAAEISKSVDAFTKSFKELLNGVTDIDSQIMEEMNQKVDRLKEKLFIAFDPANGFKEPYERVGLATDLLMDNDVIIPGVIYAFIRTLGMVANTYEKVKDDAKAQGFSFARLHLGDSMTWTIVRNISPTILKGTYGTFANAMSKLFKNTRNPEPEMPFSSENAWSIFSTFPSEFARMIKLWWYGDGTFTY